MLCGLLAAISQAAAGEVAADAFVYFNGALAAGNDLSVGENTYAQARQICLQTPACVGFTFKGTDKTPALATKVYYKSGVGINSDPNWNAYLKRPGMNNCTAIDGMDLSNPAGTGRQTSVFQQTTADQCCGLCAAFRTACQAWIHDKRDLSCTIDNWWGSTHAGITFDNAKVSGWGPGTDCVTIGVQQCNADTSCVAFSMGTANGNRYEMELYSCTTGQTNNPYWTTYRKKDNFAIPFDNTIGNQHACSAPLLGPITRFTCAQNLVNDGQFVTLASCDPAIARQKWGADLPGNKPPTKPAP